MIKHNGKQCSEEGCNRPLFARGYCKNHYQILYIALRPKKPTEAYQIPKITIKRAKEEIQYRKERKEFIEEQRHLDHKGRLFCVFCGKQIEFVEPDLHHLNGRDGDRLLDKSMWSLAHNGCHVHGYHSSSWRDLEWWDNYLSLMKFTHPDIYEKELKRMEK